MPTWPISPATCRSDGHSSTPSAFWPQQGHLGVGTGLCARCPCPRDVRWLPSVCGRRVDVDAALLSEPKNWPVPSTARHRPEGGRCECPLRGAATFCDTPRLEASISAGQDTSAWRRKPAILGAFHEILRRCRGGSYFNADADLALGMPKREAGSFC